MQDLLTRRKVQKAGQIMMFLVRCLQLGEGGAEYAAWWPVSDVMNQTLEKSESLQECCLLDQVLQYEQCTPVIYRLSQ